MIGVSHPKWNERPLLIVVKKQGASVTRDELLAFYEGKVAKWWMPDDVVFVDELPHTATGKLQQEAAARAVRGSPAADGLVRHHQPHGEDAPHHVQHTSVLATNDRKRRMTMLWVR